MADKSDLFPRSLRQDNASAEPKGQDYLDNLTAQTESILEVFYQLIPSNYVSQVKGPHYTLRFQAAAEQIAKFQIEAQEVFADSIYEFTRTEFLFQILGALVFPDANSDGIPSISGDLTYREFLRRMVVLLLQGATKQNIESGLNLFNDGSLDIGVIERGIIARAIRDSAWGFDDQFTFEINVSRIVDVLESEVDEDVDLYGFPDDPFTFQENVRILLRALKPAHTLYDFRFLFRDTFGTLFVDESSWDMVTYYYEDYRRYCLGAKRITGDSGETLADRSLFSDVTRDFSSISPGSLLTVTSGPNSINAGGLEGTSASTDRRRLGRYRVTDVLYFPWGDDPTPRPYTTSSGLSGTATVSGGDIEDPSQDFGAALEGEVLTFSEGPNAGSYRLSQLLGSNGGPVGLVSGPATRVRVSPSILKIRTRMPEVATGQSYEVTVDRLGVQEPNAVAGEDVTLFFVQ